MLKQAVGQTVTLPLLESDSLNSLSLSDPSTDRSRTSFNLDALAESEPFKLDEVTADSLNINSSNNTDSLTLVDAPETDNLFGLSTNNSLNPTGNTTLLGTYDDPIEWGNPQSDQYYWRHQDGSASCAVVAQISVYESLTGTYISEQVACDYAESQGWFDPQTGTQIEDIGKILDVLDIAIVQEKYATLNDIATALSYGDKPIVALDANEIWYSKRDRYGNPVEQTNAGHAVWVTGIDRKANGSFDIILNDSGTSYGQSEVVSYEDFNNAWTDYNRFLTVADNPFT